MLPGRAIASRPLAWGAFLVVVLGLWNSCAGHREMEETYRFLARGGFPLTPATGVRAVRAAAADDGDTSRYLAYANALLGRPYQGHFVRPLDGWRGAAAAQGARDPVDPVDPVETPPITPTGPLVPYRDFSVEYPPGFFLVALPPALLTADADVYRALFSIAMGLSLAAALALSGSLARRIAATGREPVLVWLAVAAALGLGTIAVRRYDAVVSLSIVAMVWASVAGRPVLAGVAAGLGAAAKGMPLLLSPLPALYLVAAGRRRDLVVALGAGALSIAAVTLPVLAKVGPRLLDAIAYHGRRPLQIESTAGALLVVARAIDPAWAHPVQSFGSTNMVGTGDALLGPLASWMPLLGLLLSFWMARRWLAVAADEAGRASALVKATCVALVSLMTLGKVFSPQYVVWLLPLGLVASLATSTAAVVTLLAAFGLTQVIYPFAYRLGLADAAHPAFGLLVLARNGALIAWAALLARSASRRRGS